MNKSDEPSWQEKIKQYCEQFNISLYYLSDSLSDPKVVPMIRGKSFKYSVMEVLENLFSRHKEWKADKPFMNAQTGLHDIDVRVTHVASKKVFGIECKLSSKGSFRPNKGEPIVKVKCMRSRTLGAARVAALAPLLKVTPEQLLVHNDQYLPDNFDYVVTSLANAFYQTDPTTGEYIWLPSAESKQFLIDMGGDPQNLKDFAFNTMYIAKSTSLSISNINGVVCTRKGCTNQQECGFIPNYPVIKFDPGTKKPINGWFELGDCLNLFASELAEA